MWWKGAMYVHLHSYSKRHIDVMVKEGIGKGIFHYGLLWTPEGKGKTGILTVVEATKSWLEYTVDVWGIF